MDPGQPPAPPRGRYDRHLSPSARAAQQRERLIGAAIRVIATSTTTSPPTVALVSAAAGVSRNTFYEHFETAEEAVRIASREAAQELGRQLDTAVESARTPVDRLRTLANACLSAIELYPVLARAALYRSVAAGEPVLSPFAQTLHSRLRAVLSDARLSRALSATLDESRLFAAAAAGDALAFACLESAVRGDDARRTYADVLLRTFR